MTESSELEEGFETQHVHHMAGIIPVAGQPLGFNFPWHDSLMPIANDYLAVERAVYECAAVGCSTIWIVCHKEMQTLIRHRVGEWTIDPSRTYQAMKYRTSVRFPSEYGKRVPIYYVPIHPKDRDKRDCLSWSVLYGARRASKIASLISKWTVPTRFYTAFPYGMYSVNEIKKRRKEFKYKGNVFIQYEGKTIRDGEYLGFTFSLEDFKRYRRVINEGTRVKKPGAAWDYENKVMVNNVKLPPEERWSARHFTLDKVFASAIIEEGKTLEIPWYYRLDNWEEYRKYLGSDHSWSVRRPKGIVSYDEWNPLGVDEDE